MTTKPNVPGGDANNPGGKDGNGKNLEQGVLGDDGDDDSNDDGSGNKTVPLTAYEKVLKQKKSQSERVRALEAENAEFKRLQAEAEEKSLAETNNFKKLFEAEKAKREKLEQDHTGLIKDIHKARKVNAFQAALKGQVKETYHSFINTDAIAIGDDGELDEMSVAAEVERFQKDHPELVVRAGTPPPKNLHPGGEQGPGKILRSEWKKLSSKEMWKWKDDQIIDG